MKPAIIFMTGLIAAAAGVFIRSCAPHIPDGLLTSWCGGTPPPSLVSASHLHCGGCALLATGVGLIAIAALLAIGASHSSLGRRPIRQASVRQASVKQVAR